MWHFVDLKCHKLMKNITLVAFRCFLLILIFFKKFTEKLPFFRPKIAIFRPKIAFFCTHLAHKSTSQARFVKYMNNLLFFSAISQKILNYYVFDLFIIFVCMSFVVQAVGRVNKYLDHLFIHLFIQNCLFCNPEFG